MNWTDIDSGIFQNLIYAKRLPDSDSLFTYKIFKQLEFYCNTNIG